jgi:hypothetical protein
MLVGTDGAGLSEQGVHEGGFPMVDVGNNGDIPKVFTAGHLFFLAFNGRRFQKAAGVYPTRPPKESGGVGNIHIKGTNQGRSNGIRVDKVAFLNDSKQRTFSDRRRLAFGAPEPDEPLWGGFNASKGF